MKRVFAIALVLVMLLAVVPALGTTAKAETTTTSTEPVTIRPFYGLTWDEVERALFGNLENAPVMTVYNTDGVVTMSGSGDFAAYARSMKTKLDALPEGMRYIRIFQTAEALKAGAELVIYADNGMNQLKALMTEFIEEYHAIGGQLDGIILDTEYIAMGSWYLYGDPYGGHYDSKASADSNRNFYWDVVNHPKYATDIRPLLEERGFKFYEETTSRKSEIWSMYPPQYLASDAEREKYANCYTIWNTVMDNRITAYLTEAVYEPMAALYPNATVSDYKVTDSATWENYMGESGGVYNYIGNTDKVGNTSNENMYNSNPNSSFFKDGDTYLYKNIQSYNKAVYDDDAFGSLMFNVNRFKGLYAATDTKKVSVWIAEYDYSGRNSSVKNSPYYTEFLYHAGLLDPLPFLVYMYRGASNFKGDEGLAVYNQRMKVISQALNELTRVAGYSDRKPIETPQTWNDGFMLSGMYANGRNIWRLTPDTTDGMSLLRFKVPGTTDPTFSINGNTVTFPGGKILTDAAIDDVGSCGYWIETAKDVQPVITREADHYANNPSLLETFDDLIAGTMVNSPNTKPMQTWSLGLPMGTSSSNSISMSGTTTTQKTLALPSALISATDDYSKKHQVWDVQVSLPSGLIADAELVLMTCGSDGGFKIQNKKVYYDNNGSYVEMPGVTLALGSTYRLRRSVDFSVNGAYTCDYSVYDGAGNLLGTVSDVPMKSVSLPVQQLGFSYKNVKKIKSSTTDSAGNVTYTYTNVTATVKNGTAGVPLYVESYNESNALALTGTATLNNLKLPKNITAGDAYAKHQAWEISFTLADALTTGSATLFNGLVKLEGGKAYYNSNGSYVALADIAAGTKYTIHINNNFEASTATYTLSAGGAVVAQAENVAVPAVTTPVDAISMTSTGLTTKVYLDDYKLYPTGREYSIKFYDGKTGILQSATEKLTNNKVAFRIGWMNATNTDAKGQIRVARYDENGVLVSDTILRTFDMKASFEGAETGVLENTTGSLSVYLHICDKNNTELVGFVQGSCTVAGYTGDLICKECGEIYEKGVADTASGHKKKIITGKAATCTTDGLTRGEVCELCGEILLEQQVIPAAHKEMIIAGKEATCTTAGKTEGVRCSQCATVIVAQQVIPAGHKEEILPGKEATCEADGLTEGKNCAACGEILVAQQVIPALGHTPGEAVKENIVGESCTAAGSYDLVHYCTVCDVEASRETITVEALGHTNEITTETKDATCTEAGYIKTTATCKVCGEVTETIEEIAALGHTEVTTTETKDATCTEAGYIKTIVTCSVCNKTISETTEAIAALGHAYDNNFDATCNNCGEERVIEDGLTVTAENMLQLVDSDENHIYHRVTVYFLGDETVEDIYDGEALKAIDAEPKTYWGKSQINTAQLKKNGKYVLVLNYNDGVGSKKETICVEADVVIPEVVLPTLEMQDNKIVVTAGSESIVNYRAVVYYLGNQTASNINNDILLKAMDPDAKTIWGLDDISKHQLWKSGNYVIQLQYNIGKGAKQTITKAFTVAFSELTVDVVGGKLVVADPNNAYVHHRAVVYYVGDELVNPDDMDEVTAAATSQVTYWGLEKINKAKFVMSGNYVVVLAYNLPNSPKMTIAVSVTI